MIKKIISILAIIFCLSGKVYAATYYVKTAGSDEAAGTSGGAAWATVAKVNTTSLAAGDIVYFNKGDTWSETLTPATSGESGNVITFSAYGTGDNPIIQGDTSNNNSLLVSNKDYLTFTDIKFNATKNADGHHTVINALILTSDHVYFYDCQFINHINKQTTNLRFENSTNFLADGCEVDGGEYGVYLRNTDGGHYWGTITGCTIHDQDDGTDADWDGVKFGAGDDSGTLIDDCEFYGWNEDAIDAIAAGGTFTISNCTFHDPGVKYTSSPNVQGIKLPCRSYNVANPAFGTIKGNLFYNIQWYDGRNGASINTGYDNTFYIYNNVIIGSNAAADNYHAGMRLDSQLDSEVYNNTLLGLGTGIRCRDTLNNGATYTIKNNIMDVTSDMEVTGAQTVVNSDYNIFANMSSVVPTSGGTYNDGGHNQYATDPLLNVTTHKPESGSPAINAGATIALVTDDYDGTARPLGAGYDIGAFEVVSDFIERIIFKGVMLSNISN